MSRKRRNDKLNAFDTGSTDEADFIYGDGELDAPVGQMMVARSIQLMKIVPDMAQPRRVIPAAIRETWDGSPEHIPTLLDVWRYMVSEELGDIDVALMLEQEEQIDLPDDMQLSALARGFLELVHLASSIYVDGLVNPISIANSGIGYVIESGERRYMAHHLLRSYFGEPDSIPAFVFDQRDVWKQATENANRTPLNATGMARQVALLIMAMYEAERDVEFTPIENFIAYGKCDREFYAQVADGNKFRVLDGYAERVTTATGLPSYGRVRRYRALLTIPDAMWVQADAEDWSERKIRDMMSPPSPAVPETPQIQQITPQSVPMGTVSDDFVDEPPPSVPGVAVGQMWAVSGDDYPYLVIVEQDGDMFECLIEFPDDEVRDWLSRDNITTGYPIFRGYQDVPHSPLHTEQDDEGYSQGFDFPSDSEMDIRPIAGRDVPVNPVTSRTPSAYPPLVQKRAVDDGADQVPIITPYQNEERLIWLIDCFKNMARHMDMKKQDDVLRRINLLTPASVKLIAKADGVKGVVSDLEEIEGAFVDLFNEFITRWQGFAEDVEAIARTAVEDTEK